MKTLITAHEYKHAEYYAREVLHIPRQQFTFIGNDWDVRAYRDMELTVVKDPRYRPSIQQREKAYLVHITALACRLTIKEVTLP